MGRPILFLFRLIFAARSSSYHLAVISYLLAISTDESREVDFNHLENYAATRFYCEYKTQEHIQRAIADTRLLAIPAS